MQSEAPDRAKNARLRFRLWWVGLLAIIEGAIGDL
jgi:hypothetical protein